MMPEMDGFQFIHEIAHYPSFANIPIIVLTAKDLTFEERTQLNGYVESIIKKDAHSLDELLIIVQKFIKNMIFPSTNMLK